MTKDYKINRTYRFPISFIESGKIEMLLEEMELASISELIESLVNRAYQQVLLQKKDN